MANVIIHCPSCKEEVSKLFHDLCFKCLPSYSRGVEDAEKRIADAGFSPSGFEKLQTQNAELAEELRVTQIDLTQAMVAGRSCSMAEAAALAELEQERHQLYLRIQNELDATNARLVVEAKLMIAQEALAAIMYDSIEPYTTICRNALKKINNTEESNL